MKLFCKHSWKIIDKHVEKSLIEKLSERGEAFRATRVPGNVCIGKVIQIVACDKCGTIKKYESEF